MKTGYSHYQTPVMFTNASQKTSKDIINQHALNVSDTEREKQRSELYGLNNILKSSIMY